MVIFHGDLFAVDIRDEILEEHLPNRSAGWQDLGGMLAEVLNLKGDMLKLNTFGGPPRRDRILENFCVFFYMIR